MDINEEKTAKSQLHIEGDDQDNKMDINEEKTAKSQLPTDVDEGTSSGETAKENKVIIPPNIATINSRSNRESPAMEIMRNEPVMMDMTPAMIMEDIFKEVFPGANLKIQLTEEKFKCRPVAFLLGLPFALISLIIAFVGGIIWIIGLMLTCICPCCCCVTLLPTVLAEMALSLVNAPFAFFQYITDKIPF